MTREGGEAGPVGSGETSAAALVGARAWARPLRSLLFFPGSRAGLFPKARASGADLVTADLEDAVGPADKGEARDGVAALIASRDWDPSSSAVRINPPRTWAGEADLESLAGAAWARAGGAVAAEGGASAALATPAAPWTVVVPKVSAPGDLIPVREAFGAFGLEVRMVAMIESAEGLEAAAAIARAPGVAALFLGAADLAAELGCALEWDALLYARSRVVHAAALGGVGALDVPAFGFDDPDAVEAEARAVGRLGFTGKGAIHPSQITPIHRGLAPPPEAVARARAVLEAYRTGGGGVVAHEGLMIDRPVVDAARRTLARAGVDEG